MNEITMVIITIRKNPPFLGMKTVEAKFYSPEKVIILKFLLKNKNGHFCTIGNRSFFD